MENPGRGRARGRSKPKPTAESSRPGSSGEPGRQGYEQMRRPGESRPTAGQRSYEAPQSQPAGAAGAHVQSTGGRASFRRPDTRPGDGLSAQMEALQVSGGNGSASVGRGTVRGRRIVTTEFLKTRSETMSTKKGTSGAIVNLEANYFPIEAQTHWRLFQYRVDFLPEEDSTPVRKALVRDHKAKLGGYLFDGTVLFTSRRLTPEADQHLQLTSKRQSDDAIINITMRYVGDLAFGDYHYIQFFNILMRKCLGNLKLQLVGRNYFDARASVEVREFKLELWPGYITSIRQHENQILMCSEITHKIMRQETVYDLLANLLQNSSDYKKDFQNDIIGTVVLTDYNNRTYRVDDVDFNVSPASTFKMKDGREVTYRDYFKTRYNLNIRNAGQPMLVSRTKPRERRAGMAELVYLVPELCRMTGLTDKMRGNFHLMKALADHTRVGPDKRIEKLLKFSQRLLTEPNISKDFAEWNLKLSSKLVEFEGRVLPSEKIIQGTDIKYDAGRDAEWNNKLRSNPMFVTANLHNWVVVCLNRARRDAQSFVASLQRAAQGMKMVIPQPSYVELNADHAGSYANALEEVISGRNPQLIMCIVSNNRADRYSAIKKKCCVDRAVPTQVICARNMTAKSVMSIATKVAIQINCKLGGIPWTVEIPMDGLMTVGFDVCHETGQKNKSYGAMVAALNRPMSKYFSAVSAHTTGEELSNDLSLNLLKAVRKFQDVNGALPAKIVIYRDGVGEGQIHYVFEHEVNLIRERLQGALGNVPLKLAFIIVTKRINTRIFMRSQNPPPGTVVDDCITMPERYDFYVISQSVRQGTVSPTSYHVIYDNLGLTPDRMQRLTYKMTHLYYNWSGTVRVPAPCQYAHKLAYLVGQALHRPPNPALEDTLYFL